MKINHISDSTLETIVGGDPGDGFITVTADNTLGLAAGHWVTEASIPAQLFDANGPQIAASGVMGSDGNTYYSVVQFSPGNDLHEHVIRRPIDTAGGGGPDLYGLLLDNGNIAHI